jgi:hypothetical protein
MATTTIQASGSVSETVPIESTKTHKEPLRLQGVLDQYESFDVTPIIGQEFPRANLKEWLEAPNSDELLRDLAITSQYSPVWVPSCGLASVMRLARRTHSEPATNSRQSLSVE